MSYYEFDGACCLMSGCQENHESDDDRDLSSRYSLPMNTAREFLNSNHPLMEKFREKIAFMEFGPIPFPAPRETSSPSYEKSAFEAKRLRILGNESYRLGENENALKYYSKSIATAPTDSEELALAFGNRSAVLMCRKMYDFCLLDVNRALNGKLPDSSKQKLLKRKQESWTRLQKQNRFHLQTKETFLLQMGRPLSMIEEKVLNNWTKVTIDERDLIIDNSLFTDEIWSTQLNNALLPDASPKVKLESGSRRGQYCAIAADDIAPGEVLLIQESHTVMTTDCTRYDFCAYCTMWCEALIPCFTCSQEMYCSESCRQRAYDSYHRTECKILRLWWKTVDEKRIALMRFPLRVFLAGTGQGSRLANLMDDPNVYAIMDKKFNVVGVPYTSNDYLAVLNSLWKLSNDVHIIPCAEMLFNDLITILYALRSIKFFDGQGYVSQDCGSDGFRSNEGELFTALLLLQHMRLGESYLAGNSHAVLHGGYNTEWSQNRIKWVGRHLGSFEALINHSCEANAEVIYDRRRRLIYSTRPIPAGEQIFISHSHFDYTIMPLKERRECMEKKFLKCTCRACIEAWPKPRILYKRKNVYLTSNKKTIKRIEKEHKWWLAKAGPDADSSMYDINDNVFQKALAFNKTIREYVKEPSATIFLCELAIKMRMRLMGNFYVVPLVDETWSSGEVYL